MPREEVADIGVRATAETLADLLISDLANDGATLRKEIPQILDKLVDEGKLIKIDEEYSPRRIIRQILFGMRTEVLTSPAIWFCLVCYRCYAHCPQKVNFPDLMRVLRYLAIKGGYVTPDILENTAEIDKRLQILRHDLIKYDLKKVLSPKTEEK